MRATVYLTGIDSATVEVDVPDGLDPDEAREVALSAALERGVPGLCHSCTGYGHRTWSREGVSEWGITAWNMNAGEVPMTEAVTLQGE